MPIRSDLVAAAVTAFSGARDEDSALLDRLIRMYPGMTGDELAAVFRGLGRSPSFGSPRMIRR